MRNSQASVLAPTGTIGLLMDCDTTGVEPDLGLVKTKKLVGGGTMSIVNQTVPRALTRLGYSPDQVDEIIAYIDEHKSIVGAPYLSAEHLAVFACSMGDNTIHYLGHVRMMGAVQPFISGAISKTVNLPEDVTRGGRRAAAHRRLADGDQGRRHLPRQLQGGPAPVDHQEGRRRADAGADDDAVPGSEAEAHARELNDKIAGLEAALAHEQARTAETVVVGAVRERLPRRRKSSTFAFRVADCEGYVTVGEYEDGRPGEVFMKVSKQGSTLAGIMDAFSISVSLGLQHGVPLATYVRKYTNMRFEPAGITDDPELRIATSLVDYIFRRLAVDYLPLEERAELGVLSTAERMQPTLPGVEETATPSTGVVEVDALEPAWTPSIRSRPRWSTPAPRRSPRPPPNRPTASCPCRWPRSRGPWPGPSPVTPRTATSAGTPCSGPARATCAGAAAPPAAARSPAGSGRAGLSGLRPGAKAGQIRPTVGYHFPHVVDRRLRVTVGGRAGEMHPAGGGSVRPADRGRLTGAS